MKNCKLCESPAVYNSKLFKLIEATTKYSQHHFIIVPNNHTSNPEMNPNMRDYYFRQACDLGNSAFPTGYWIRFNEGKYLSIPEHFHIHIASHDGDHTPGAFNRCFNCEKYVIKK